MTRNAPPPIILARSGGIFVFMMVVAAFQMVAESRLRIACALEFSRFPRAGVVIAFSRTGFLPHSTNHRPKSAKLALHAAAR
jgi:hypothetical protein